MYLESITNQKETSYGNTILLKLNALHLYVIVFNSHKLIRKTSAVNDSGGFKILCHLCDSLSCSVQGTFEPTRPFLILCQNYSGTVVHVLVQFVKPLVCRVVSVVA